MPTMLLRPSTTARFPLMLTPLRLSSSMHPWRCTRQQSSSEPNKEYQQLKAATQNMRSLMGLFPFIYKEACVERCDSRVSLCCHLGRA